MKVFFIALIYFCLITLLTFNFSHSFFSSTGSSTNNVFAAAAVFPTPTPIIGQTLVINEVLPVSTCKDGNKATNWIEVWNGSNTTVDLKNFKISDGTSITDLVDATANLTSGSFALIAKDGSIFNSGSSKGNKCFASNGAQTLNLGNTSPVSLTTGTLELLASDGTTVIDKVQFNGTFNGVNLTPPYDQSIERVPLGHDSVAGNNFLGTDFIVKETPTPGYGSSVLVNEFVANVGSLFTQEWVELYNSGPSPVNLNGWSLEDNANHNKSISALGSISVNGFKVYSEPSGWLNDGGDTIYLKDSLGRIIDSHTYTSIASDKSIGRKSDGSSLWVKPCATATQDASNNGSC